MGLIADDEVIALLAFQHRRHRLAAGGGFDGVLHIGHVDAEAGGLVAVHREVEVGLADDAENAEILHTANLAHDPHDVVPVDLNRQLALDATDGFLHVVGDGLRKIPDDSGDLIRLLAQSRDQLLLVLVEDGPPLLLRPQVDEVLGVEEAGVVGAIIRPSHLAHHFGHFREPGEHDAGLIHDEDALSGTGTGGQRAAGPDGAFVEVRQEFRPNGASQQNGAGQSQDRRGCGDPTKADGRAQRPGIGPGEEQHQRVAPFLRAPGIHDAGQHGDEKHGEQERARQGEGDRPGHGPEQAAFHALEGEDGHVGGDDNGDRVENRPLHLMRGPLDFLRNGLVRMSAVMRQEAHDVLHHDDGALHDHAEIQRAEGKQVGGDVAQIEAKGSEQEGERNGESDDERAAYVAEEDKENDGDQNNSLGQVVKHGMSGEMHEVAAIQVGNDLDTGRQEMIVEELDFFVQGGQYVIPVGAFAQQHNTGDHIRIVDDLGGVRVVRFAHLAEADLGSLADRADIADAHRNAVLRFQDNGRDVVGGLD